jgi:hypothetical protein
MDQPMEQQYGTQELIEILAAERQACLRGERLSLSAGSGHPVIDVFLQTDGSQSYSAFQDFKAAVHQYQLKHQVSGLQWQTVSFKGESLTYPVIHPQLWAIDRDFTCLGDARDRVVSFWRYVSAGLSSTSRCPGVGIFCWWMMMRSRRSKPAVAGRPWRFGSGRIFWRWCCSSAGASRRRWRIGAMGRIRAAIISTACGLGSDRCVELASIAPFGVSDSHSD